MLGLEQGRASALKDAAELQDFPARLQEQMELVSRTTVTTDEDKVEYAAFEKLHADYHHILPAVARAAQTQSGRRSHEVCSTKS